MSQRFAFKSVSRMGKVFVYQVSSLEMNVPSSSACMENCGLLVSAPSLPTPVVKSEASPIASSSARMMPAIAR